MWPDVFMEEVEGVVVLGERMVRGRSGTGRAKRIMRLRGGVEGEISDGMMKNA